MPSKISIIILNFNGLRDTIECLESLKKITYQNYNVVLVDNASKNNEGEILKEKFGDYIHLIQNNKNYGFAEGNNFGIRHAISAGADCVLCLNNDTTVEPNFLDAMVDAVEQKERQAIGMVAGKMMNFWDRKAVDNFGLQITQSGLSFNILDENSQYLIAPCGGLALYSVNALEKVKVDNNFFDPDFFMYNEDLDLGLRMNLLGYRCEFAKDAKIYHKGGASSKHFSNFHVYYNQRNIIYAIIKNFPLLILIQYGLWIILLQFGLFLIAARRCKTIPFLRANYDIMKNITKILKKRKIIQTMRRISSLKFRNMLVPKPFIWSYFLRALKK